MSLKSILGFGESKDKEPVEESASQIGAKLKEMAEKFDIPETFGGEDGKQKEIVSISGFKEIGGVTYAIAYCDDRCTYDVPLTLKAE